jgi:hypothetical protein
MSDDEIDELIERLRAMLIRAGFGSTVEEAEHGLYPTAGRRARALALIDAAEGVTVDLADIELRVLDRLGAEEVVFRRDNEDQVDDPSRVSGTGDAADTAAYGEDRLRGPQRRGFLTQIAARRGVFRELRRRLDGEE